MSQKMTSRTRTQQSNLNFATLAKAKTTANDNTEANNDAPANTSMGKPTETEDSDVTLKGIMSAINDMKTAFSSKFDGIFTAVESIKKDIIDCSERVTQTEVRISTAEDDVSELQAKVKSLEGRNKTLEEKVLDLEARSRRSNVRLVNLPEGAEASDVCGFLESWIPEALDLAPLRGKLTIERAHRLGPRRDHTAKSAPRTLIMKFLNYKDKEAVMRAARMKRQILYKNQPVRFYPDMATEMHKKVRAFGEARRQLRALGLRYGMIPPARLIVTYKDRSHIFNSADEAEDFIKNIEQDNQTN